MQHTRKISDYNVNRDDRVEYDRMLLRYPTTRSTTSATPTATSTISRNPRLRGSIILCSPDYTICTKGGYAHCTPEYPNSLRAMLDPTCTQSLTAAIGFVDSKHDI